MSSAEPITVAITRRVDPARHAELIAWLHAGSALAERFPGYLGAGWVTSPGSDEWHMLYRFADPETLRSWEDSSQRTWWLESAGGLVEPTRVEKRTGIEGWFDAPEGAVIGSEGGDPARAKPPTAPPRWKQMVTIFIVFLPLSLVANATLGGLLDEQPLLLRTVAITLCMTPVMTYLALPWVTRTFAWWLHGRPSPWRLFRRTS